VKGDVRLINSKVFAADYSMRFPTVVRTRWDKPPAEVQTHEELCQLVQQRVEAGGAGFRGGINSRSLCIMCMRWL
jgi:hypothetical protein